MAYLSSMPIGKRVFLSKYHDLVSPDKRNPYKENLRFEDREDVLEDYNQEAKSKSILEYQKQVIGDKDILPKNEQENQRYKRENTSLVKKNTKVHQKDLV